MPTNVVTPNNLGNEFDLGVIEPNKIHVKVDNATVVRDPLTGVISAPSASPYKAMPEPKIEIMQGQLHSGVDYFGQPLQSDAYIFVRLNDIPPDLLNTAYRPQLELLRVKASGRSRQTTGYRRRGRRFVHPSDVVAGVHTGTNTSTRAGNHKTAVTRKTVWDLTGYVHQAWVKIPVADVLGSYFFRQKYSDITAGFGIESLAYSDGQLNRHYSRVKQNIQARGREVGLFAFRYSLVNPATGRYESSAMSHVIVVANKTAPTIIASVVNNVPTTVFPYRRTVNPNADGKFELTAKFQR